MQKTLEELGRVSEAAEHHVRIRQPERTDQECPLRTGPRRVDIIAFTRISHHETVSQQLALDGCDGTRDAGIVRRQKSDLGNEEQGGIERVSAISLDKRVARLVEAGGADVRMDLVAYRAPAIDGAM